MSAEEFLDHVKAVLDERQAVYGDAEKALSRIASRWSERFNVRLSAKDVALMMMDLKLSRLDGGAPNVLDSLTDLVGYAALFVSLSNDKSVNFEDNIKKTCKRCGSEYSIEDEDFPYKGCESLCSYCGNYLPYTN